MASVEQDEQGKRTRAAVLEVYRTAEHPPSMREVGDQVGLAPSAVKKYVDRLVLGGQLEKIAWGGRFKYRAAAVREES